MNLTAYMLGAAGAVAIAAMGWASWQSNLLRVEKAENAILARSVTALEAERQAAKAARDVARAEAKRFKDQAEEYAKLREDLLRGNYDTPIPDWLTAYLERLLGGDRDGLSGAADRRGTADAVSGGR